MGGPETSPSSLTHTCFQVWVLTIFHVWNACCLGRPGRQSQGLRGVTMQWLPTQPARLSRVFPEPSEFWKHVPPPRSSQGDRLPRRPCSPTLREQRGLSSPACKHGCDRSSDTQPLPPCRVHSYGHRAQHEPGKKRDTKRDTGKCTEDPAWLCGWPPSAAAARTIN